MCVGVWVCVSDVVMKAHHIHTTTGELLVAQARSCMSIERNLADLKNKYIEDQEEVSGCLVRLFCVAVLCGCLVRLFCVAVLCGCLVWLFCAAVLCGCFVWMSYWGGVGEGGRGGGEMRWKLWKRRR